MLTQLQSGPGADADRKVIVAKIASDKCFCSILNLNWALFASYKGCKLIEIWFEYIILEPSFEIETSM